VSSQPSVDLLHEFGAIDIYVFDQLLKGAFDERRRILDAGCGSGRNLPYFLRAGFDVYAVDNGHESVAAVRALFARLAPALPAERVQLATLDALPWDDGSMDAVICSAVLHFANDHEHFGRIVQELWRVLAPGGLFFARLASSIGLEHRLPGPSGRMRLPDGSTRFVVDEAMLESWTKRLGGRSNDPLKTTIVQAQRCMTTWVLEKS
jgi:tellurite methyltransferase